MESNEFYNKTNLTIISNDLEDYNLEIDPNKVYIIPMENKPI